MLGRLGKKNKKDLLHEARRDTDGEKKGGRC